MKTIYRIIILLVIAVGAAAAGIWFFNRPAATAERTTIHPATINEIRPMVQLATIEIYRELPVKAQIGKRHLVARQIVEGSISFDLEKIGLRQQGDTTVVLLPKETITLRESTEPGSYQVIDTWNEKFLGSTNFTIAEENDIKTKSLTQFKKSLYKGRYVDEARAAACRNITGLLSAVTNGPVVVEFAD